MRETNSTVDANVYAVKAGAAWTGTGLSFFLDRLGFSSWGDVAAFLAAIYSLILIGEWLYKKIRLSKRSCDQGCKK